MRHRNLRLSRLSTTVVSVGIIFTVTPNVASAQPKPFQPTYEDGFARHGLDYRSFSPIGPSALYCQQACLAETQCRAWTYESPRSRNDKKPMCWLKSGVPAQTAGQGHVAGVVRPEDTAAFTASQPNPPPAAATSKPFEYKRTVQSGLEALLAYERYWDANCQPLPLDVVITQQPTNGLIWSTRGTSTIPETTPRGGSTGACAGKTIAGNHIMFRSQPGFHGTDTAAYDLVYDNGRRQVINVTVDVTEGKVLNCTAQTGMETRCTSHLRIDGEQRERAISIAVTTPPANGEVITKVIEEAAKMNDGRTFNGHAAVIFYRSKPSFIGQDSFTYRRVSDDPADPNNGAYTMRVTVK
jgi:PAN domain